jgi:hypothetical protein
MLKLWLWPQYLEGTLLTINVALVSLAIAGVLRDHEPG